MSATQSNQNPGTGLGVDSHLRLATLNISNGFQKKVGPLLKWAIHNDIDVFAVQETGSSPLPRDLDAIANAGYHLVHQPHRVAGVALLVRAPLMVSVVKELRWKKNHGRLVGLQLQVNGSYLIIVCCYMPTNLDRLADDHVDANLAGDLYAQVINWMTAARAVRPTNVVVMGDLNETMTDADRENRPPGVRHARFVSALPAAGFLDAYRVLHPLDGWTSETSLGGGVVSRARLDYVWTAGFGAGHVRDARVPTAIADVKTSHLPLVVDLAAAIDMLEHEPVARPRLPDLRRASAIEKEDAVAAMVAWVRRRSAWITATAAGGKAEVTALADAMVAGARDAASHLPLTGGQPHHARLVRALHRRRDALTKLKSFLQVHPAREPALMPDFTARYHRCGTDLEGVDADLAWPELLVLVKRRLKSARADLVRAIKRRGDRDRQRRTPTKEPAVAHRILHGDRAPPLRSIIDPGTGNLVTEPAQLKSVLRDHFAAIFQPRPRPSERPAWLDDLNKPKPSINPAWYDGLMSPITNEELTTACKSTKPISAPGPDGVASGVWSLLISAPEVCTAVGQLLSACLRLQFMPPAAKRSMIVPIAKKHDDKSTDNLRPISLQNSIFKLLTKIIATRLGGVFASHPILHPAQEGFLPGRDSRSAVRAFRELCENAKLHKKALFAILYDIRGAYDSVRHDDIIIALERLRLPRPFIEFIRDSVTGLVSCVRTMFGNTDDFDVLRSVRQGDPLAPLIFVCVLDALHCGMHANPLYPGRFDGYEFESKRPSSSATEEKEATSSKGYADDTLGLSKTFDGLWRTHCFVVAWSAWHVFRLHGGKSLLAGVLADGGGVSNPANGPTPIRIEGELLTCVQPDEALPYLGVLLQMDLGWRHQVAAIGSMIGFFCHRLEQHRVGVDFAVWAVNTFLIPQLAYRLAFVNLTKPKLRSGIP